MGEAFALREAGGVTYLEVEPFRATGVARGIFSTRLGGVSRGPYAELNLGLHVGDGPANVAENRRRFAAAAGFPLEAQVTAHQVHGTGVGCVRDLTAASPGDEAAGAPFRLFGECDALITDAPDPALTILVADCVPVYFLDPVRRAAGIAHAGWRGTVGGVGRATLEAMSAAFGVRPADCLVAIGPSIGPCCYEVDRPVIERLAAAFPDEWSAFAREAGPGRWRLDLREANRRPLAAAGVPESRIFVSGYCTACRRDLFYSYRMEGPRSGRLGAVIRLTGGREDGGVAVWTSP